MLRRFLAILLIALALATLAVYARAVMAPLTLSIGSAPIALVQAGVVNTALLPSPSFAATLPVASTAGTTLVVVLSGDVTTTGATSAQPGWTRAATALEPTGPIANEIWIYPNNPGGILTVPFVVPYCNWMSQVSEWSNVASTLTLETSGTATAVAGTTLTVTTTAAIVNTNDVAIAAWFQRTAAGQSVTFTTPSGWLSLGNNGLTQPTYSSHQDAEYLIGPALGPLSATLTSNRTTTFAAGVIVVLKAAPPVTDQTAYLAY